MWSEGIENFNPIPEYEKLCNKNIETIETQDIKTNWFTKLMNRFGYYKIGQLTTWGNCGCCGKPIRTVLPKDWNWGICKECMK
jgi:hypothetical protein